MLHISQSLRSTEDSALEEPLCAVQPEIDILLNKSFQFLWMFVPESQLIQTPK